MKKNENKTSKFVCIVLLLCVIAMILVAGTYAKYTSKASGTATATVAKWDVVLNGNSLTVADSEIANFNLFGDDALIYPGATGSFKFEITNKSQVAATYGIAFDVTGDTVPLEYSIDNGATWASDLTNVTAQTLAAESTTPTEVTVQWRWADLGTEAGDTADTTLGVNSAAETDGLQVEVTATLTVEQAQ